MNNLGVFVVAVFVGLLAALTGGVIGDYVGANRVGNGACSAIGGKFATLNGKPICMNSAGGVLKLHD